MEKSPNETLTRERILNIAGKGALGVALVSLAASCTKPTKGGAESNPMNLGHMNVRGSGNLTVGALAATKDVEGTYILHLYKGNGCKNADGSACNATPVLTIDVAKGQPIYFEAEDDDGTTYPEKSISDIDYHIVLHFAKSKNQR